MFSSLKDQGDEDSSSIRNLTDNERDARERALENAKIRNDSDQEYKKERVAKKSKIF